MSRAEKALVWTLGAAVLLSPVFLGGVAGFRRDWTGVPPTALERFLWADGAWWALLLLGTLAAGLSLVVAAERRAAGEPGAWRLHGAVLLPLAALILLALVQSVPLPRWLLGLLSPRAAGELEGLLPGDGSWRPLTISPGGTRQALPGLALGGAVLLGTLLAARRRGAALLLLWAAAAAFAGSAAYGLHEEFLGGGTVLGFPKRPGVGVTGTFLNRSHMAAGAGAALCLALGFLWLAFREGLRGTRGAWAAAAAAGAAVLVLALTVPLTRSRMGLGSAAAGLVALGLLAARAVRWPPWGRGLVVLAALGIAGGATAWAVREMPALRERFAYGRTDRGGFFDIRFPAWKATLALASRYPVLGTGIGSYEVAIHETQTAENPDELVHAHSEPLEALAEGGLPGLALAALLAAGAVAGVLAAAAAGDGVVRVLGCSCGGALAVLATGCLTEFHLHVPALGIAAAVLAAAPAALAAGEPGPAPAVVPGRRRALVLAAAALLLAVLAAAGGTGAASLRGGAWRAEQGVLALRGKDPAAAAREAAAWLAAARDWAGAAPRDAAAWRSLAGAWIEDESSGDLPLRAAESLRAADRAVDLEPFHPWGHWARAVALAAAGRIPEGADAIGRALSRAGGIGHLHLAAGSLLLQASGGEPSLRPAALGALREAGRIVPQHFSRAWEEGLRLGLPPGDLEALVPDRPHAWTTAAEHWRAAGEAEREMRAWARVAELDPRDARARERCLDAGRRAGMEDRARGLLAPGPR